MTSIPTASNVDHHAFTVPDLDEAVRFFTEVLGAQELYRIGPVQDDGDWMRRQLAVHPRASAHIAMLRLADTNIELFEYTAPGQRTELPRNSDVGGHHLAIGVADIDAAVAFLRERSDVTVLGDVQTITDGPIAGNRWVYFRAPWGLQMELQQVGEDLPYEKETDARLYRPVPDPALPAPALPTALGVDHLCYTVPDLDQALEFFTGVLGGELLYRVGIAADADYCHRQLDVPQDIDVDAAMVRLGPVTNIELFQYTVADQRTELPRNSDIGGHHLAFYVEDVDAAVAHLRTVPGVEVLGEPQLIEDGGPIHGDRWVYFRAPWGLQMEVLNMPDGMPYEQHTSARRFGPSPSWNHR
ncbi:glyoxalase/bleomycin resistance/dioxygenase family protein [Streptomyces sp. SID486]|uniref:VOC family protein n=1 Tax=unclassified Streptomyces TaxID=2593676 RepID=UPI00136B9490|nr:glyoxalase/bleomycin resistance/dioxygenase family protein [Streptomyces sp. SID161]MYY00403.1 glyoxalase/bleomycin resistance/dioxygenase family protein [Streptomyces sp. SID486]